MSNYKTCDEQTVFYLVIGQRSEDLKHIMPRTGSPENTGLAFIYDVLVTDIKSNSEL